MAEDENDSRAKIAQLEKENARLKKALGNKKGVEIPSVPTGKFAVQIGEGEEIVEFRFRKAKFTVSGFGKVTAKELLDSQEEEKTQHILAKLVTDQSFVIEKVEAESKDKKAEAKAQKDAEEAAKKAEAKAKKDAEDVAKKAEDQAQKKAEEAAKKGGK